MAAIDDWFDSGEAAYIAGYEFRPRRHTFLSTPLAVTQGQATSYSLDAADNSPWILKRFLPASKPQRSYIDAIANCVPPVPECRCGWERRVLTQADLAPAGGLFFSAALAQWLDESLLMPRLSGVEWGDVLWGIADGSMMVDLVARVEIAHRLAKTISLLEQADSSHRDLSQGNILVDQSTRDVHVIDWDTLYHPSLLFQNNTKLGSPGYMAPWVENSARSSWCSGADRFALAICITELLAVTSGTTLHGDGSLFEQMALGRDEAAFHDAVAALNAAYQPAVSLFDRAWHATGFDSCPAPEDWVLVLEQALLSPLDQAREQLEEAIGRDADAEIVQGALEWRRSGGGSLPGATRARVLLARRRMEALRYLQQALQSDDDGLIAHRYHASLLDQCSAMTPQERERVASAFARAG